MTLTGMFTNLLATVEGKVAAWKLNAGVDTAQPKFAVGPDSDYATNPAALDHSAWDGVVRRHVSPGSVGGISTNVVDYRAVANDPSFDAYKAKLAGANLAVLRERPNELLALYINAYNALCIGHVVRYMKEHGGALPKSVTEASTKKGTEVWDVEAGVVGGESVSLNDIEHGRLRTLWADPRVHASIVCASASCPNLRAEAFVPARLNEQMDDQARGWVSDPTKGVKADGDGGEEPSFSRIFLWFKEDFAKAGGPAAWASQYLPEATAKKLGPNMQYFKYDWSLNAKSE